MKCFRLRCYVNNSFLVFHQGTKRSKTIKHSRFALVFHTVFSCLDPLMKHSNSLFTYNMQVQNHSQPMQTQNHSQPVQVQNHSQPVQVQNHSQPMQDRVILNHACNWRVIFNPFKYRVILNLCKYHRNSPPSPGAFWIYILSFCPPLVRMCYGCGASLKPSGHILPPPHDLVVVSNMLREYLKMVRLCENKEMHTSTVKGNVFSVASPTLYRRCA
jgi:hypothetical protein